MDAYRTVATDSQIELIEKKSRFIGRVFCVTQEAQALDYLAKIRKQHYDATHNCYAYRIGKNGETARFSDDGEPGGTAGLPMMEALKNKDVTNLLCIVTRYFGGVLLGAGGLVRAYSHTCSEAVEAAKIITMQRCVILDHVIAYDQIGRMEHYLRNHPFPFEPFEYGAAVASRVYVPIGAKETFVKEITELFSGSVQPVEAGDTWHKAAGE